MAASGLALVRVQLLRDYPPPYRERQFFRAVSVDLDRCSQVAGDARREFSVSDNDWYLVG